MAKFDKTAFFYKTFVFKTFYKKFHRQCFRFVRKYIKPNFKILDVACGTGNFLNLFQKKNRGAEFFGIDESEKMLEIGRKKFKKIKLIKAQAEAFPFSDNYFDFISIIDAFFYFSDKQKVFSECSRVLKPNGFLFLYIPSIDNFLTKMGIWSIKWFYTEKGTKHLKFKEIEALADTFGLKVIKKKLKGYPISSFFKMWFILFQKN